MSSDGNGAPDGVSPFADRRGGPAVYDGIGYQTGWMTLRALQAVHEHLASPSSGVVLQVERREIARTGAAVAGQVGFDFGIDDNGGRARHEVKFKASKTDVLALASLLPATLLAGSPVTVLLVTGEPNTWVTCLSRLRGNALEASDDAELMRIVHASADARRLELLGLLGDRPLEAARLLREPLILAPAQLDETLRLVTTTLAGARADDLGRAVASRLATAAKSREALPVQALARELVDAGLLHPITPVPAADDEVIRALAVLDVCTAPLPEAVLAEALGHGPGTARRLLRGLIDRGLVLDGVGGLLRPRLAVEIDARYAGDALSRALTALLALPAADHAAAVAQAGNVVLVCRVLVDSDPRTVGLAFKAYDKAVKGTGSLALVVEMAERSVQAIGRVRPADDDESRDLLSRRAHARICGTGWTLQRFGELDRAAAEMETARSESEAAGDRENLAFIEKCLGRLSRLRAERHARAGDHRTARLLYQDSAERLERAFDAFEEVVANGATRLAEEPGECLSLLGRTLLSSGDPEGAARTAATAHRHLDRQPQPCKAWADLVLLDVELTLQGVADRDAEGDADPSLVVSLGTAVRALDEVVRLFTPPTASRQAVDVGSSEILARAHRLLGRLHEELGDDVSAAAALRRAADHFHKVEQAQDAYPCELRAMELGGELPRPLLALLDERQATVGTRVEALRLYAAESAVEDAPSSALRSLVARGERAALLHHRRDEAV